VRKTPNVPTRVRNDPTRLVLDTTKNAIVFDELADHSRGVIIGTIAAIVLTPLVVRSLRRLFPPQRSKGESGFELRKNERIAGESTLMGIAIPCLLVLVLRGNRPLDFLGGLTILSGILSVPIGWILIRTKLHGSEGLAEFERYFESKYGYRFLAWRIFGAVSGVIGSVCLIVLMLNGKG